MYQNILYTLSVHSVIYKLYPDLKKIEQGREMEDCRGKSIAVLDGVSQGSAHYEVAIDSLKKWRRKMCFTQRNKCKSPARGVCPAEFPDGRKARGAGVEWAREQEMGPERRQEARSCAHFDFNFWVRQKETRGFRTEEKHSLPMRSRLNIKN